MRLQLIGHGIAAKNGALDASLLAARWRAHGHDIVAVGAAADLAIAFSIDSADAVLEWLGPAPLLWAIGESDEGLDYLFQRPARADAFAKPSRIVFTDAFQRDTIYASLIYKIAAAKVRVIAAHEVEMWHRLPEEAI